MTKQEAIRTDFINALKTIKTTNQYESGKNYETNIGNYIKDWNEQPLPTETVREVIVEDRKIEHENNPEFEEAHYQTIIFTIKIYEPGKTTVASLRKDEIDIMRCIGANEDAFFTKYGDTVFSIVEREKDVVKKNITIGGSKIIVKIKFGTKRWLIGEPSY